jgi:nucleoside-diphosphate-sugar epimerase/2-polyprenyl-3-methyl-5-hydroxy-6-metoxy-1,4-benzoquinol methylase
MTITVISHIFNEAYLLPFWLEYHKKLFDYGIIIDYDSTDNSVDIIKSICPTWKVVRSRNAEFGAEDIDKEVMDIENTVDGYKICLNTTEFLITTQKLEKILLKDMYSIKPLAVARTDIKYVRNVEEFLKNFTQFNRNWRGGERFIHKYNNGYYNIGRHASFHENIVESQDMFIAWVGFYPWNDIMLNRKLQIQTKIPLRDKLLKFGSQHITDEDVSNIEANDLMKDITYSKDIHPTFLNYTLGLFSKILIIGGNGYIGTSLYEYLSKKYNVDIMDINWGENNTYTMDYKDITLEIINNYDTIILLAGNSSVKNSTDLMSTFTNNVSNFINLISLLKNQKLIYASSGSIYGSSDDISNEETVISNNSYNNYDLSKKIIDMYSKLSDKHIYGLRFGTVNGFSKNLRIDLVINSMVTSALKTNELYLYSKESKRAILGLNDLNRSIERIIEYNDYNKKGIYNLCSFNTDIETIAKTVSSILNTKVVEVEDTTCANFNKTSYSFQLDNSKFKEAFNFTFTDNLETLIRTITNNKQNSEYCIRNKDIYTEYSWKCKEKKECRVCFNTDIKCILNLGKQPLANSFHDNENDLDEYPLKLMLCDKCYHLQLSHIINPNILFKNYIYVSGTSNTLIKYFQWFAEYTLNKQKLYNNTLSTIKVLEIACNDASQLDQYKIYDDIKTIGVDPAQNIYNISSKNNHKIYCVYWNRNTSENIKKEYSSVDIIIAENVFAHTDDIHSFLEDCKNIMNDDTVLFIQTSQANMVRKNEYDTVYHEHLSFFSVKSMNTIVRNHDLYLNNIDKSNIHGTSFIFEISKTAKLQNVVNILDEEKQYGIHSQEFYEKYANFCINKTEKLKTILHEFKSKGYTIISYGASAKGNTILNFLRSNYIDYIVDDNPLKWELYTPGTNIIVKNPLYLKQEKNKIAVLMLTWNFRDEIMKKLTDLNLDVEVKYIEYNNI